MVPGLGSLSVNASGCSHAPFPSLKSLLWVVQIGKDVWGGFLQNIVFSENILFWGQLPLLRRHRHKDALPAKRSLLL